MLNQSNSHQIEQSKQCSNNGEDEMSRLLISEQPLQFSPTLAIELGSIEATVFLQQLHFWVGVSQHQFDGKNWVYNNITQCLEMVKNTISKRTLERIISDLKKRNLIVVDQLNSNKWNKTNYFTLNYEELANIDAKYSSNLYAPDTAKMAESIPPKVQHRSRQNGGIESAKMAECLQKNTTEEYKHNSYSDSFEKFWSEVPNKDAKKAAATAFKKAIKLVSVDDLIVAYKAYIQFCDSQQRFKKNPSTWLNQECWNDESIKHLIDQLKGVDSSTPVVTTQLIDLSGSKPKGFLGGNQ
ncbi:hypothetical protein [Acinetobacter gyllenbergii]|uniref:hypothetical protein n=1 Tax=Acinetobacter gyllenbergii TaxID=134534 RepID=UPI001BB46F75|nr:hypothetical protein [Acinetobacter gyllenbergii]